jgi:hypothetical protein
MSLNGAKRGEHKVETVRLFRTESLDGEPARCQLTLAMTGGPTLPQRYCFEGGKTIPGACR